MMNPIIWTEAKLHVFRVIALDLPLTEGIYDQRGHILDVEGYYLASIPELAESGPKLRSQLATCEFADAFALLGICVGLCACLPTCLPKEGQRGEPGPWKRNHRGTTYTFTSVTTGRASCYPSRPNVDGGAQFFSTPCTPAAITARR